MHSATPQFSVDAPSLPQSPPGTALPSSIPEYGKKNPFPAETLAAFILNGRRSAKDTYHLELSLAGSGLTYEPGDALAVIPVNVPATIEVVLAAAKLTGGEEVEVKNLGRKPLMDALREDYDISGLSRAFLTKLAEAVDSNGLRELLAETAIDSYKAYCHGREIVDAIEQFAPAGLPADTLVTLFRRLPPRLYSIASSPLAHPDQAHITVAAVRYHAHGRERKGVCTNYLADLVNPGDRVPVFIQPNKNFRLPADTSTPMIMVGSGTGIAPYRAFVEHRATRGDSGNNWLFFGNPHREYDFFYESEWLGHLASGWLTRLDVAFSRDQAHKIYVQQRLLEQAEDLYAWLEEGAHFYVCGNASDMAVDVHAALLAIIETQGGKSPEAAVAYV